MFSLQIYPAVLLVSLETLLFFWPLAAFGLATLLFFLFRKRLKGNGNSDYTSSSPWSYSDSPTGDNNSASDSFGGYGGGDGGGGGASGDWGDSGGDSGGDGGGDGGGGD